MHKFNHTAKFGKMIVSFILIAIIAVLAFYSLWNWLMPKIFDLPTINIYEAIGLLMLSKLIFGFTFFKKRCGCHRKHHSTHGHVLTEDEKESFKDKFKNSCFK